MKGNKGTPQEGGTRVPVFFSWKGALSEGVDIGRLTAHIDFFPTLAALAGAGLPDNNQVEGRSLLPLLRKPEADWEDRFLFTHVGRWERGSNIEDAKFKRCAVRSERFRLINNTELYDMDEDPGQSTNVIEKFPDIVQEMREAYDRWWEETKPLMVNENTFYEGTAPYIKRYNDQLESRGIPIWDPPAF